MLIESSPAVSWRTRAQRLRLEGEICPNPECQIPIFPPRDICPKCRTNTITGEPSIKIFKTASPKSEP